MKVRNLFFAVLASAAVFAGCEKTGDDLGGPSIKVEPNILKFDNIGGADKSQTVTLTATRDWNLEAKPEWVEIVPDSGKASADPQTITVTVKENTGIDRSAKLNFSIGLASATLTVSQDGSAEVTYATLADVRKQATDMSEEGGMLGENLIVKVVVTSDASLANYSLPQSMVTVQDASGAIQLDFNNKNTYKIGDELIVDLSGKHYEYYKNLLQVQADADKTTVVNQNVAVEPKEITVTDFLTGDYQSQYVAIKDVQAVEADIKKMLGSASARTTISIEDAEGRTFVISHAKTNADSPLNTLEMPAGSGVLKGIASVFGNTIQLFLAKTTDVDGLTGERFVKEEPTPTGDFIFISEYLEGSSSNKYIELYNPNDIEIDLGDYFLALYTNGNFESPNATVKLEGTIAAKGTVVYKNEKAAIYDGEASVNSAVNFNGDDVLVLRFGSQDVDIFGPWDNPEGKNFAKDETFRRNQGTKASMTWNEAEWTKVGKDNASGLGKYPDPVE